MSMFSVALRIAIVYYICKILDDTLAWDATWRPLFAGWLTGLALGDTKTGLIMGAELEGIYMGISAIGGVIPSDPMSGTIIPVASVIASGASMEVAIAMAVPLGSILDSFGTVLSPIALGCQGLLDKYAAANDQKRYAILHYIYIFVIDSFPKTVIMFFATYVGAASLEALTNVIPASILNGINVASNMMVAIGFGILTSMIWDNSLAVYFFIGFALTELLGLSTIGVAVFAVSAAVIIFTVNQKIEKVAKSAGKNDKEELF